jgi:hypothetical protein
MDYWPWGPKAPTALNNRFILIAILNGDQDKNRIDRLLASPRGA